MDVLRYLVAVVLLAGMLIYGGLWIITPAAGPAVDQAQASEADATRNPSVPAQPESPLPALSPIYPTLVGKGAPLASGPSAEQMRKKLQGNVAERPRKKGKTALLGQKSPLPAGADAYASNPAPSPSQAYLPYTSEENR